MTTESTELYFPATRRDDIFPYPLGNNPRQCLFSERGIVNLDPIQIREIIHFFRVGTRVPNYKDF